MEVTWDDESGSFSSKHLTTFNCYVDDDDHNDSQCSALNISKDGKYLFAVVFTTGNTEIISIDLQVKKALRVADFASKGLSARDHTFIKSPSLKVKTFGQMLVPSVSWCTKGSCIFLAKNNS